MRTSKHACCLLAKHSCCQVRLLLLFLTMLRAMPQGTLEVRIGRWHHAEKGAYEIISQLKG